MISISLGSLVPFALLAFCPLMMILMMRRMHGMHDRQRPDQAGARHDHDATL